MKKLLITVVTIATVLLLMGQSTSSTFIPKKNLANIWTGINTFNMPPLVRIGTSSAVGVVAGTYAKFVSGAGVGNGADTTNDALWTLTTIPANAFTSNGDTLILTTVYKTGVTANNKAFGVTVGGTQIATGVTAANGVSGIGIITITRVDSTHLNVAVYVPIGNAAATNLNMAVSDLTTNALTVAVTGSSPTTGAANDVKLYSGVAEFER